MATATKRQFSCSDEVWDAAKAAWTTELDQYPSLSAFIVSAIEDRTDRVRAEVGQLPDPPAKIAPGRSVLSSPPSQTRSRHSFYCTDDVWVGARAAWMAQRKRYGVFSDWIEDAVREKTTRTGKNDE